MCIDYTAPVSLASQPAAVLTQCASHQRSNIRTLREMDSPVAVSPLMLIIAGGETNQTQHKYDAGRQSLYDDPRYRTIFRIIVIIPTLKQDDIGDGSICERQPSNIVLYSMGNPGAPTTPEQSVRYCLYWSRSYSNLNKGLISCYW